MKKNIAYILISLGILTSSHCLFSQQFRSVMQEQSEYYSKIGLYRESSFDSLNNINKSKPLKNKISPPCTLTKKVFGWHPYWNGSVYTNYQWNLISDLCYFDYTVSSSTGNNTNGSFAWNTASVVTVAKNNGVKIHICATLFNGHSSFLGSIVAQNTFISNIITLLNNRQGNGVNIDFEGMSASDKIQFVNFITSLNTALNSANPNYQLSVCLYAVDWSNVFDIPALNNQVDFFTLMGYDYYYGGSAQAGPTAPLYNFQTPYNYTLPKSITYYLRQGIPNSKLILGLPYYGREWEVTNVNLPASTTGNFNASRTLSYVNNNPSTYSISNKYWDNVSYTPYYNYLNGGNNRQCFIDDPYSLGRKYDLVNQRALGGIGIWALGYDDGMMAYWNLLRDKFSTCAPIICNDSLFDMGGPARNYYDNEKYDYTLTAPTGSLVQLQFKSFGTELNYDSLWIYNGSNTLAPMMGSFTGTNSPGTLTSSGQNLTLRFKSDGATVSFGFKAIRSCVAQSLPVSIVERWLEKGISLYPNPTNGNLFIRVLGNFDLKIMDLNGKLIFQKTGCNEQTVIDLTKTGFTSGIYLVKIQDHDRNTITKKIVLTDQ